MGTDVLEELCATTLKANLLACYKVKLMVVINGLIIIVSKMTSLQA
jgi:hypothetical protein